MDQLLKQLKKALEQPLPGKKVQITMAPRPLEEERFEILPDDSNVKKGAVLFLLYPDKEGTFVPFIKRSVYQGVHSNQVSLPGGKWEKSDADLQNTAIRETEEELGVDGSKIQIIGKLSDLYIPPSKIFVSPFVGFLEEKPDFKPDPREVSRIIRISFTDLLDTGIQKKKKMVLSNEITIEAPYYEIDREVVWGATAMVLSELIYLYKQLE